MVDVNTQNKTISVNVSSSGVSSNVNASGDTSHYYSEKAREWAISNRIVDGVDYSSKYYAGRANQSALNAQSFAQSAQDSYNNFQDSVDGALSNIDSSVQGAITTIDTKSDEAIEIINNSIDGVIEDIEAEANEQISNIERTGFYMRDDKLYFINSVGEEEEFKTNDNELNNPYSLGDSKYSPRPLNNLSWLKSEGQYNPKDTYPSYYDWALINANNGVEGFKFITDEYTDYDVVINPANETFRLPLLNGSESLPSDRYDELILGVSGTTYTAPANGWYILYKQANSPTSSTLDLFCTLTNDSSGITSHFHGAYGFGLTPCVEVKKGDVARATYDATGVTQYFRFIYAQGNGSLYFYVGETVQNANLINAGRIEETLAGKVDRSSLVEIPVIVETYVNGHSWYRVWSDGFKEQGGYQASGSVFADVTVTFLKPFSDANYTFLRNIKRNPNKSDGAVGGWTGYTSKTATSVTFINEASSYGLGSGWYACGY